MECVVLAVACLITYWLATHLLSRVYSVSWDDDLLGGMWAVLATIFVLRDSFGKSVAAGVSRMSATLVSFVFCLIYLAFLPFHAWALAVLVGASALAVMLLGRPGNAVTAGITTAVILVVAAVTPSTRSGAPSRAGGPATGPDAGLTGCGYTCAGSAGDRSSLERTTTTGQGAACRQSRATGPSAVLA